MDIEAFANEYLLTDGVGTALKLSIVEIGDPGEPMQCIQLQLEDEDDSRAIFLDPEDCDALCAMLKATASRFLRESNH